MAGVRQQPTGFSKVQVLATALDPRTKDLFHVPVDEHALVQTLVVQAAHEENIRKTDLMHHPQLLNLPLILCSRQVKVKLRTLQTLRLCLHMTSLDFGVKLL